MQRNDLRRQREREILPELIFVQEGLKCYHYGLSSKNQIPLSATCERKKTLAEAVPISD